MVQQSMVKRTREAKKNAAIAAIATKMAKDNGDVLYKKSQKFKKLFFAAKAAISKKYFARARSAWTAQQSSASSSKDKK